MPQIRKKKMGRSRKKKIIENLEIVGIADKGKGVGRTEEGVVVFVDKAIPGDIVNVLIKKKKKAYMQGFPIHYHKYSDLRIEPFCEHFQVCGGCKWQHLDYQKQLEFKEGIVFNALKRIGKVADHKEIPIKGSNPTTFYRNKLEFSFSNKKWLTAEEINTDITNEENVLGFHPQGAFSKVIDVKKCHLQPEPSNKIRLAVKKIAIEQGLAFFDIAKNDGYLRQITVRTSSLNQNMLIVGFYSDDEESRVEFLEAIKIAVPEITSLFYYINAKMNDFSLDLDHYHYAGKPYIEEKLRDVTFRIGPKSFFQTNPKQAEALFNIVEEMADLDDSQNVYDLYTGIGSIALYIAHKCKQIVGIEEVEPAIEDAKVNMKINNIENAVFYAGDVKYILTKDFAIKHGKPDVLITDPPRVGMHQKVIDLLLELEAPKIVYVSCNPATQARDVQLLSGKYDLVKIQPVDMFPHTHHIENVGLLILKSEFK